MLHLVKNIIVICLFAVCFVSRNVEASSRIKDIADFEGVRENQLIGYGLVVGLNGTGDNIKSINFAKEFPLYDYLSKKEQVKFEAFLQKSENITYDVALRMGELQQDYLNEASVNVNYAMDEITQAIKKIQSEEC